jgi:type I restriction enzyme S subunit
VKAAAKWPSLPLTEAFWFQEGPGVRNWQFTTSGIKLLNVANIEKSGTLNLEKTDRHLDETEVAKKYSHFLVDAGDLVIASSGISFDDDGLLRTRGAFVRAEQLPLCLNTSTIRFKALDGVSDLRFLRLWLNGREFRSQITKLVTGTAQQNFGPSHLKVTKITLPPLAEQRRIAEVLDRAEALRTKRRVALAQLDSLTQSIFLDLFGDPASNPKRFPTKLLASLVRDDDTINYGVVQPGDDLDDGIPLVRVGDLIEGKVRHAALKRIAPSIEAAYKRSRLRGDEILVSCVGSIGVVALADESVKGFNIVRAVARIPLAETTSRIFIAAYLSTDFVRRYFTNELRTVSQPTLNIKQISETTVVLPPIELQREFARRIQAVEKLKTAQRASLAELDALFASLQHRAFRGEL